MKHNRDDAKSGFPMHVVTVRQASRVRFHRLVWVCPVLVRLRSGCKTVLQDSGCDTFTVRAGECVLLPGRLPLTLENAPIEGEDYLADALPVAEDVFERAYGHMSNLRRPQTSIPIKAKIRPEVETLFDFFGAPERLSAIPEAIRAVRLVELVTWLAHSGAVLGWCGPEPLTLRLRKSIAQDPGYAWSAQDAARLLNMSEATLRRKLTAEGAGFSAVLRDVRLTHALTLLQATALPVNRVALEAGYASPSQFAARFRERFGIPPGQIRARDTGD